jgi:hypothetical protein
MELTEIQKKDLQKYSLLLNSLNEEDGISWSRNYYDGEWEDDLGGPFYNGKYTDEPSFIPKSIEELFDNIVEGFDTSNFYDEMYDNETGTLYFEINAQDRQVVVTYEYPELNSEETSVTKTFVDLVNIPNPWYSQNNPNKRERFLDKEFINELKTKYGNEILLTYEGGGDEGWINDFMETDKGEVRMDSLLEDISYNVIDLFHGGWENNEGSNGSILINLDDEDITITHNNNYVEEVLKHNFTLNF